MRELPIEAITRLVRKSGSVLEVRDDRIVTFRSSTPDLDRHGTRILPLGIRTDNYDRNPVFLWGHDGYGSMFGGGPSLDSVIGRTIRHVKSEKGFDHDVEFAPTPEADKALKLVRTGFLNSTSIGFEALKHHEEQNPTRGGPPITVFDEVDLLEVSLVPIPSNPNAQALARMIVETDELGDVLKDGDKLRRLQEWVRSAMQGEPRSPADAHPTRDEQRSRDEHEDEQRSPLADLIANVAVNGWRPKVGSQLLRALDAL